MAILDVSSNEIVIRVVYDGTPESGKTTSLRALAGSLAQTAVTPDEDATGRTLWFDWMEYVGGRFEGSRIRCQIVSVPGQRELDARRRALLASADVVVSVIDTTPEAFALSLVYVNEVRRTMRSEAAGGMKPGIVLQANKRDRPDAVPLARVIAELGPDVGFVESVAADGTGIREAFVYAVRLALDRVRDLMNRGALVNGAPAQRSAAELLAVLRGNEVSELVPDDRPTIATNEDSVAATALTDVLEAEERAASRSVAPTRGHAPKPPDAAAPSGAIWPPVEGRAILAQVAEIDLTPHCFGNGDWVMGLGSGWRIVSRHDACYRSLDEGRVALIQWARMHATVSTVLSPSRCIVLSEAGDGSWRLWQIVRVEETLREVMTRALDEATPEQTVLELCEGGKQLLDTVMRVAETPIDLACTLDTIGSADDTGMYIGLMPSAVTDHTRDLVVPSALLKTELGPVVAAARIGDRGVALQKVIDTLSRPIIDRDGIMSTLVDLFA